MIPLLSIIVPIYRTEEFLEQCLDSILAQTYANLEIILVDDGSPDGCGVICDRYAAADSRIRVVHQENGGRSSARNAGLELAGGEWIGWVDSDDWIEPDMYEVLLNCALESGAEIAACGRIEERDSISKRISYPRDIVFSREQAMGELIRDREMGSYLCDKLFRRELFRELRFPQGRDFEDVALTYRLFQKALHVAAMKDYKYHYRFHAENIVNDCGLSSRMDYWHSAWERYGTLLPEYPQLEREQILYLLRIQMEIWAASGSRSVYQAELALMRDFAGEHIRVLLEDGGYGRLGRLRGRLIRYDAAWAFLLSRLLYWAEQWNWRR